MNMNLRCKNKTHQYRPCRNYRATFLTIADQIGAGEGYDSQRDLPDKRLAPGPVVPGSGSKN